MGGGGGGVGGGGVGVGVGWGVRGVGGVGGPERVGRGRGGGVGGVGEDQRGVFSKRAPMPCVKTPMVHEFTYAVWVACSSTEKLAGYPALPPPPPRFAGVRRERGRFSPPFPIQHAARVGGP